MIGQTKDKHCMYEISHQSRTIWICSVFGLNKMELTSMCWNCTCLQIDTFMRHFIHEIQLTLLIQFKRLKVLLITRKFEYRIIQNRI